MNKILNTLPLTYLTCLVISISFALYNGYPFVYYDTGVYLRSGIENWVPSDRPIFYGLFIKIASLKISLWFVILIQSALATYVIKEFFQTLKICSHKIMLFVLILLVTTTGLSFNVSRLIPDIFTSLSVLLSFVLVFAAIHRFKKIILSLIYIFFLITHISNSFINFTLLIILLLFLVISKHYKDLRIITNLLYCLSLTIVSVLIICFSNYIHGAGFIPAKCSHVFMIGRMSENGILKEVLDMNCPNNSAYSSLCEYRNSLPKTSTEFVWSQNSPLKKIGGCNSKNYMISKMDYKGIIYDSIGDFELLKMHLMKSFEFSYMQVFNYDIISRIHSNSQYVSKSINKYFPHEYYNYMKSKSQLNKVHFSNLNFIQHIIIILSLVLLIILNFSPRLSIHINNFQKIAIIYLLASLIINASVTGSLSNVSDRYQNRVIWLLPMISFSILINVFLLLIQNKISSRTVQKNQSN